jgi:hypothetical protein
MRKALGSLSATLAVALVMAAAAVAAAAMHSGSKGCATKESCAASGLDAAVASSRDAGETTTSGAYDAGDHVDFSLPSARAMAPAAATGRAPGGMALDPDGLEGVVFPLNDTGSVVVDTVRTPDAPEFGFDVSVQAAGVRFPYLRYPPLPDL